MGEGIAAEDSPADPWNSGQKSMFFKYENGKLRTTGIEFTSAVGECFSGRGVVGRAGFLVDLDQFDAEFGEEFIRKEEDGFHSF